MNKYEKTPSSHPPAPSERFPPGAPTVPLSAVPGCRPESLGGRSQRAFSHHSGLCNCDEASSRFHLPAAWKQRSAFTPHSRSHCLAAVSPGKLLPGSEGSVLQVLGPLFTPGPTPVFPSPTSPISNRGKERRRGQMEGWGCWVRRSGSVGYGITLRKGGQEITRSGRLWRGRLK